MISDDQTNINKYRVAAIVTEFNIISKLIFLRIIFKMFTNNSLYFSRSKHI